MHLMLSWKDRNTFENSYIILENLIHIIKGYFGTSGFYGSRYWSRCIVDNIYTWNMRGKIDNDTPIHGPELKNCINFH